MKSLYFSFLFVSLFSICSKADQDIIFQSDTPKDMKQFSADAFEKISQILGSGKMAPHLRCLIKDRQSRMLKKFISGEKWIDILDIEYIPYQFETNNNIKLKIPITAMVGYQQVPNQWSGVGEQIRIELGDHYSHWIEFIHDGEGRIVQINAGNILGMLPCRLNS